MLYFPKWKIVLVVVVALAGILLALPNLFSQRTLAGLPDWMPSNQINLGLDLQGGAHLLYELDERELIENWLKDVVGDTRETLRRERIGYTGLGLSVSNRTAQVRIPESAQIARAVAELEKLSDPVGSVFTGETGRTLDVAQSGDQITLRLTDQGITRRVSNAIESSIETVRRRIDAFGTTEPIIQRQGRDRILVQVPGVQDVQRLKDMVGKTGRLDFKLVDISTTPEEVRETGRVPPGSEMVRSSDRYADAYVVQSRAMVTGENLVSAEPAFDQQTNEPVVTFRFDSAGARRFGRVTQENVGQPFAIILDETVISAPVIREPILGGTGQISGNFTVQSANDLAVLLRSGALPGTLTIIEERTVGASLGADSVEAGKLAGAVGLVAVLIFMVAAYGLFGLFAATALVINIALIMGALSALGATLTLPGIAGIVLTIGMAVDANVLIFERIREEARSGKSAIAAIDTGYSRALTTILDANITTLIATVILFWLGSGPIRGFAVTLSIGILTSVFTAFTLTRLVVAMWVRQTRPAAVPI